jgi:hypothetical protein
VGLLAEKHLAVFNAVPPTSAINNRKKAASIIATANGRTAPASPPLA